MSIGKCVSYDATMLRTSVKELLRPLGGIVAFVKPGQRVLLKVNLVLGAGVAKAINTHPEIIRAVALEVREAGATPVIGDSPAFGSAMAAAKACGIAAVAREMGIEVVDLGANPRAVDIGPESPFPKVKMGEETLKADVIINLPKVKTHSQMGMTIAVKNMYGAIAGKGKTWHHFFTDDPVAFGRMLVGINRYLKPGLTIADGIIGLERNGPCNGDPRNLGILAASSDPVALDRVVVEILGVDPATVPTFEAAGQMGYGQQDLERIEVTGETIVAMRATDYVAIAKMDPISFTLPRVLRSLVKQIGCLAVGKMKAALNRNQ